MSRRPKQPALTLDLDDPKITAVAFRKAVDAFFSVVDDVSRQIAGSASRVSWVVSVRGGSIHLSATPEAQKPDVASKIPQIARAVKSGIALVSRRPERPRYFSDDALRRVRELASISGPKQVQTVNVTLAKSTAKLTQRTVANIDALLGTHVRDYGTLEGRLMVLSAQGGPNIAVVDPLTDRAVRCWVSDRQLDEALRAFRRRVAVTGLIAYRSDGQPNSIQVDDFTVFPDSSELPSADEVHGILSKTE